MRRGDYWQGWGQLQLSSRWYSFSHSVALSRHCPPTQIHKFTNSQISQIRGKNRWAALYVSLVITLSNKSIVYWFSCLIMTEFLAQIICNQICAVRLVKTFSAQFYRLSPSDNRRDFSKFLPIRIGKTPLRSRKRPTKRRAGGRAGVESMGRRKPGIPHTRTAPPGSSGSSCDGSPPRSRQSPRKCSPSCSPVEDKHCP